MNSSSTFGIEKGKGDIVISWLNKQAEDQNLKAHLYGYDISTQNFGEFEMFSWKGDHQVARKALSKASKRFKIKVIEGAYRPTERALRLKKYDYAIVKKGSKVIGHLEFAASRFRKSKWKVNKEERR